MTERKRRWFQLHLSTWIVFMLLVSAIYGVYLNTFSEIIGHAYRLDEIYETSGGSWFAASWSVFLLFLNEPYAFLLAFGGPLIMLFSVVFFLEWSIRRRERTRSPAQPTDSGSKPCP